MSVVEMFVKKGLVALHQTEYNLSRGYDEANGAVGASPDQAELKQWW